MRNLDDGRVELVAEGAQRELDLLLDDIAEEMGSLISGTETAWSDATGEFDRFEIRR